MKTSDCEWYKKEDMCWGGSKASNGYEILKSCPKTCNNCNPCIDELPNCPGMKGQCDNAADKFSDGVAVFLKCKKTCNTRPFCGPCTNTGKYSDDDCDAWKGDCDKSSEYYLDMMRNCGKSCGKCLPGQ